MEATPGNIVASIGVCFANSLLLVIPNLKSALVMGEPLNVTI